MSRFRFSCRGTSHPPGLSGTESHFAPNSLANPHEPLVVDSPSITTVRLGNKTDPGHVDRVLIVTPLRDAASHLRTHFQLLSQLTYPHQSVDLAFLVGDGKDSTLSNLNTELAVLQNLSSPSRFRSAIVIEKDFGDDTGQSVEERHSFKAQGVRRRAIARARNYLLYTALMPAHEWVYWRDVDIVENPPSILEDFMKHDKDIVVPSRYFLCLKYLCLTACTDIWFHRYDENGKDIEGRCKQ